MNEERARIAQILLIRAEQSKQSALRCRRMSDERTAHLTDFHNDRRVALAALAANERSN
jgi:hypothetical protein